MKKHSHCLVDPYRGGRRRHPAHFLLAATLLTLSGWAQGRSGAPAHLHPATTPPLAPATAKPRASTANLQVNVLDPSGASVPKAQMQWVPAQGHPTDVQTANQHGQMKFNGLNPGSGRLLVAAKGFQNLILNLRLHAGENQVEAHLQLAEMVQQTTVHVNHAAALTSPSSTAFSIVLTPKELQQLPDDPDQFAAALQALAGPGAGPTGATMRVDGFGGGQLPPKSQIQSVQFNMNPFSAAYHTPTGIRIMIHTKPGIGAWHGQFSTAGRDTYFDARNAFSPAATPEAYRRGEIDLEGPLWQKHTSMFLSLRAMPDYSSTTILATTPQGEVQGLALQPSKEVFGSMRISQLLPHNQLLQFEYQRNYNYNGNQGVGGIALDPRAYFSSNFEHVFRLQLTGPLGDTVLNQLRFQGDLTDAGSHSNTLAPGIDVLGAFDTGGAGVESINNEHGWYLNENLDWVVGHHQTWHFIGRWEHDWTRLESAGNQYGTFTFPNLAAFLAGQPSLFSQKLGYPWIQYSQNEWAGYAQDDWQIRNNLSVSLGMRYEGQSHIHGAFWAPRAMLSFAPFRGRKTVFRLGFGLFNEWFNPSDYGETLLQNGIQQYTVDIFNPCYPDPNACGQPKTLPPSILRYDPNMRLPYREQGSLMVSRTFGTGFRFFGGYFVQRGLHGLRSRNLNAPLPDGQVPNPAIGNLLQIESSGKSLYQALRIGLVHFSPKLFYAINYALAQQLDDYSSITSLPANNYDINADWGPSNSDARDRLFGIFSYSLTDSLRLFSMFHANTATPYNITLGQVSQNGQTNARPPGIGRNSARGSGAWDLNTRLSYQFGWGNGGGQRMMMGGPGGRRRGFFFRGGGNSEYRWNMELYLQAYNVFNHVNYINYDGVVGSPFFGLPMAAEAGRRLETGLWLRF